MNAPMQKDAMDTGTVIAAAIIASAIGALGAGVCFFMGPAAGVGSIFFAGAATGASVGGGGLEI